MATKKVNGRDAALIAEFRKKFAVSYSRISLYEQCPAKMYYKTIAKLQEAERAALKGGLDAHKDGEDYLKGKLKKVPKKYEAFVPEMVALKKHKAESELEWAFTRGWSLTGWWDKDCWMRVKTDAVYTEKTSAVVVDFKTGRRYDDKHEDCAGLYALATGTVYPKVQRINVEYFYLDIKKENKAVYLFKKNDLASLRADWERRAARIERDDKFLPRLNKYCGNCDFRRDNGGPCPF